MKRHDGRLAHHVRPLTITENVFEYAPGSVLLELGKTKVLCAVTLQSQVPPFLRASNSGWLTAEYALLPASTQSRTQREISTMKRHHRSVEISRLISRCLRAIVDLSEIGDRTITIDCDILQADGGTRTASIMAAYVALILAQKRWRQEHTIKRDFIKRTIAALSVGILDDNRMVLDPDFHEDSTGKADINFIMTHEGDLIEVQGGAEKQPIAWKEFIAAGKLAQDGIASVAAILAEKYSLPIQGELVAQEKKPLFSLSQRHKLVQP